MRLNILICICLIYQIAPGQILLQDAYPFQQVKAMGTLRSGGMAITSIAEDSLGQVWAENGSRLIRLWPDAMEIALLEGDSLLPRQIEFLFADLNKHIWVQAKGEMYHIHPTSQRLTKPTISFKNQPIKVGTHQVAAFENGLLLVQAKGQLIYYNKQTGTSQLFYQFDTSNAGNLRVFTDRMNRSWVMAGQTLYRASLTGGVSMVIKLNSPDDIWQVEALTRNEIFLSSSYGNVYKVVLDRQKVTARRYGRNALYNLGVWQLPEGACLLVMGPDGIYLHPNDSSIVHWNSASKTGQLQTNGWAFKAFQSEKQGVWLHTQYGTWHLENLLPFQPAVYPLFAESLLKEPGTFISPARLNRIPNSNCLIFHRADSLFVWNTKLQQLVARKHFESNGRIFTYTMLPLDAQQVLISTSYQLFLYQLNRNTLTAVGGIDKGDYIKNLAIIGDSIIASSRNAEYALSKSNLLNAKKLPALNTVGLFTDEQGYIFKINRKQLYKLNEKKEWETILSDSLMETIYTPGYQISSHPKSGSLFLINSEGIRRISGINYQEYEFYPADTWGLATELTDLYALDENRWILVSPNMPAMVYNRQTRRTEVLGFREGWRGETLGSNSQMVRMDDGSWWALNDAGLVHYPSHFFDELRTTGMQPILRKVFVNTNRFTGNPEIYRQQALTLKYNQLPLTLDLAGKNTDSVYARLLPLDSVWTPTAQMRLAALPAGNYQLQIREAIGAGEFTLHNEYKVTILPPFWQTIWFKVLAALGITLIIWLAVRWQLQRQQAQNQVQLQLAQSELKAIRSQMNPHFIFNCMTAIDGLIATGQSQKASTYLSKFSKLVRQVLQLSEKQLISLADEMNTLQLYLQLEQLRMQDAFTYSIAVEDGLAEQVELPPMLLQPFVENSIIHGLKSSTGNQKRILISVQKNNEKVIITIEDNGIGRQKPARDVSKSTHHQSMGTRLTTDRLKIMEQVLPIKTNYYYTDLTSIEELACGTRVTIEIIYLNEQI